MTGPDSAVVCNLINIYVYILILEIVNFIEKRVKHHNYTWLILGWTYSGSNENYSRPYSTPLGFEKTKHAYLRHDHGC